MMELIISQPIKRINDGAEMFAGDRGEVANKRACRRIKTCRVSGGGRLTKELRFNSNKPRAFVSGIGSPRARIMEKQHSIMIFKVFFAFTIAAAAISHSISLSPDSSKATNAAASCTQDH
ncbi:hypothetical protein F2Q69_00020121 [Brassica cretica]|uniref:Uncharacterized protein n=1 Tax=Brassica cretica TaxID=69181 RepID=A0A8S9QNN1_BRACR|nr:hypothetical protein F2Q69_00020121 [Brassica cretica]